MTAVILSSGGLYLGYYMGCFNPLFEPIFTGVLGFDKDADKDLLNYYNGIINMLFSVGAMLGVFVSGTLADTFGRRAILYSGEIIALVCCVPYSYAEVSSLMTARAISGMVAGINSSILTVMMAELLPNSVCGFGSGFFYLMMTTGTLTGYVTQNVFDRAFLVENWRYILLFPGIISIARLVLFPIFIKTDTPKYIYFSEKNKKKAEAMIARVYSHIYISTDALAATSDAISHFEQDSQKGQVGVSSLFSTKYRKRFTSGILVAFTLQFSGINFFTFYSTKLFDSIEDGYGKTMTLVIGINNFFGSMLAIYFIGKLGRKFNLVMGLIFQGVGMYLLVFGNHFRSFWALALGCCIYTLAFAIGFGGTETAYLGEILPPSGVGTTLAFQWTITAFIGQFMAELIDAVGSAALLIFFAATCTTLVFLLDFVTIETKGKTEQAVVKEFESGKYKFMDLLSAVSPKGKPLLEHDNAAIKV